MKVQVTKDVTAIVRRLSIICDRLARDQLIVRFTRYHSRGAVLPPAFFPDVISPFVDVT
jgi:hypothetical protein